MEYRLPYGDGGTAEDRADLGVAEALPRDEAEDLLVIEGELVQCRPELAARGVGRIGGAARPGLGVEAVDQLQAANGRPPLVPDQPAPVEPAVVPNVL